MIEARAGQTVDPAAARRDAQHILSDRRFRSSPTPRPLRGPLQWLGDRLTSALDHIGNVIGRVPVAVWVLLILVGSVFAVRSIARRRQRRPARADAVRAIRTPSADTEDPDALERAADAAERDGDLDRAVRLRFRAGLLRLGDRGAIAYRPSVTTGEVRRALGSARFDDLAGTFEAVTYGGRTADEPDVDRARREWPQVLQESGRQ